jgi:hypothetical protein
MRILQLLSVQAELTSGAGDIYAIFLKKRWEGWIGRQSGY